LTLLDYSGIAMRTRVKICGITRRQDARAAAQAGADAIGLVFYSRSPRAVTVDSARDILSEVPAFVTVVGLFVNAEAAEIHRVLEHIPLDLLQFHGDESPEYCRGFGRPYIRAIRMQADTALEREAERFHDARGLLLDTYHQEVAGGSGETFDWSRVPEKSVLPLILAGGLSADNVQSAIRQIRPYAVDVSSGVESAKGIKDADKIVAFINQVSRC
jgi:phosphoribosylanthranilate isomerase